jgi:hypothetical protein
VSNDFFFSKLQAPRFKPWLGFNDHEKVFFVSVHGYGPREPGIPEFMMPQGAFYPGSGATKMPPISIVSNEEGRNIVSDNNTGGSEDLKQVKTISESDNESENENENGNESDVNEGHYEIHEGGESESDDNENDEAYSNNMDESQDDASSLNVPVNPVSGVTGLQEVYQVSHDKPLILDVGVKLPDSVNMTSSEYRHQWRNYFR